MKKVLKIVLIALLLVFATAQFVRPDLTNPPVDPSHELRAPANVQAILDRSCRDCHSNRTRYPWYAQISPLSWWLKDHITEGRRELNFSEFATYKLRRKGRKLEEICEEVKEGEMPLKSYLPMHPSAKLSDADRR
ncbi:MAG TPA: heme-binding domain-containing protein, partial [Thermoanaerobaculia bacterium]